MCINRLQKLKIKNSIAPLFQCHIAKKKKAASVTFETASFLVNGSADHFGSSACLILSDRSCRWYLLRLSV